ncbi:PhnB protein [Chitinophaga terrae (ex Kim and Jung 2007)]|uniref:PhnB protein n=1 Tax=Chitinophaga terrae (ex Kim and Jung 2007) TaxID=408074 RepID=A0A1H4BAQ4_9BACT|nr:VOC family protein [Chitinophaga terrae (ex Kim and Jung 2007)]SEA45176.1 PhnB protein [Chitinophaga terrae (ex Kim and Jung 2007)]
MTAIVKPLSIFTGLYSKQNSRRYHDLATRLQTAASAPGPENNIMHVALPIGRGTLLMGSDTPEGSPAFQEGNNFALALNPDNEEEAKRLFAALSEGGTVIMPMEKTFWGALFGLVKDAYGISWMVNYMLAQ